MINVNIIIGQNRRKIAYTWCIAELGYYVEVRSTVPVHSLTGGEPFKIAGASKRKRSKTTRTKTRPERHIQGIP